MKSRIEEVYDQLDRACTTEEIEETLELLHAMNTNEYIGSYTSDQDENAYAEARLAPNRQGKDPINEDDEHGEVDDPHDYPSEEEWTWQRYFHKPADWHDNRNRATGPPILVDDDYEAGTSRRPRPSAPYEPDDDYFDTRPYLEGERELPSYNIPSLNNLMPQRRALVTSTGRRRPSRRHRASGTGTSTRAVQTSSRIPVEYLPVDSNSRQEDDILNLDCTRYPEKEIDGWCRANMILWTLNEHLAKAKDQGLILPMFALKMKGNVKLWYEQLLADENKKNALMQAAAPAINADDGTTWGVCLLKALHPLLLKEFVGKELFAEGQRRIDADKRLVERAKWHLDNMKICDMYYLRNFICEYEKYFYRLSETDRKIYIDRFYNLLPQPWGKRAQESFEKRPEDIQDNLRGRICIIERIMEDDCIKEQTKRQVANINPRLTCDPSLFEVPIEYGCRSGSHRISHRSSRRSHRRSGRRRFKKSYDHPQEERRGRRRFRRRRPSGFRGRRRRTFRKQPPSGQRRRSFRKGRPFFRRRRGRRSYRNRTNQEDKNCPQGKANCKCWICKEEGHYASSCPKKNEKQYSMQTEILEYAYAMKMEPVEDDISDSESLYLYQEEEEEESEYEYLTTDASDPGTDWESCDESGDTYSNSE